MSLNSSGTIVPKLNLSAVMRRCGNRYNHAETYLRFSRVPRNHGVLLCRTRWRTRRAQIQSSATPSGVRRPLEIGSDLGPCAACHCKRRRGYGRQQRPRASLARPRRHRFITTTSGPICLHLSFKKYTYLLTVVLRCHTSVGARLEAMCYVHRQPAQLQWRLLFNSTSKLGRLTYRLDPLAKDRYTECVTRRLT